MKRTLIMAIGLSAAAALAACSDPSTSPSGAASSASPASSSSSPMPATSAVADTIDARPTLPAAKVFAPPAPEIAKLPNGMTLWLLERHTLPLVAVSVTVPVGSSDDPAGKEGLASITADMLDEGAGARSAIEVSTALQDLGVNLKTSTSLDGTILSLTVLKKNFGQAFGILADVVARPKLEDKEWKRVSDLWRASLIKRADDPNGVARVVGQIAAYGRNHPYGHPTDGFASSAKVIDLAAVKAFYGAQYRPERVVLSVAGDITKAEISAAVEEAFGSWKPEAAAPSASGAPSAAASAAPKAAPSAAASAAPGASPAAWVRPRLVLVDRPDAPQSVIAVVREGVRLEDASAPLHDLVNTALGGSFTSRLNQNLREDHGWTYGAGSAFTETKRGGSFVARAAVETKHTGPALDEMVKELKNMAASGLTPEELPKVLAQDRADLVQAYESVGGIASRYATLSALGLPPAFDATASRTRQSATVDSLKKIAQSVDPEKATIVVVGPRKELAAALSKWGDPELWDAEGIPAKK